MNTSSQDPPSRNSGSDLGSSTSLSQLQSLEGYEYDFDPPVDSRYECPICLLVLRDPSQTKCGHRFCRECILRTLKNSSLRCPIDNEPLSEADIFPDNYAKREILNCNIKCPNKDDGCKKIFPLCELKAHIQECQYTLAPCPNKCGSILPRRDIDDHVGKFCGLRIVMCTCCGANMHAQLTQDHVMVCPKVPIKCDNCHKEMNRDMINHHLQTACEQMTVMCPFYPLGCGYSVNRRQEECMAQALSSGQSASALESTQGSEADAASTIPLVFSMMEQITASFDQKIEARNKEIAELKSSVSNLKKQNTELSQVVIDLQALVANSLSKICCGKFYWTIQGFSGYKQRSLKGELVTLHSQPFFTSTWGYKMCLRANITQPQTASDGSSLQQHLSLFVHVMQGDNDALLPWPFTGKIMLALLDQNKDESLQKHVQETLEAKPNLAAFQRPVLPRNQKGFGFIEFMPVSAIEGGSYLLNDCLVVYAQVFSHA
ncbi:hypothetical protein EGW08_009527, partial [Elysia chlorotica]